MRRIAVIFEGRLRERKGVFNAVMSRVGHLRRIAPFEVDVHMIEGYDHGLNRWLHGTPRVTDRPTAVRVGPTEVTMHWFCHSLKDSVAHKVLGRPAGDYRAWLSRLADTLAGYDLYSAHDRIAGTCAAMAATRQGVPHCITWHGASIYTDPPRDPVYRMATIELLRGAACNFFVSRGLERFARATLTADFRGEVLYNAADDDFKRHDDDRRRQLRAARGIAPGVPTVGFVGRMEAVKNVLMLPELFAAVQSAFSGRLQFIAVGDGPLQRQVSRLMSERGIECLMPGGVPHGQMPDWMNCIDVLLLPSRLEGFGLVAIEALRCGARVVGSDAQGIPEVIGAANAFALDGQFVAHVASRAATMLGGGVEQSPPPEMQWSVTARRELEFYLSRFKNYNL